ncbi:GerAB/ArcD/ProY family transporter [Neobacillus mesonae]|uniref:GerAB/ArcD/ProY family transporter n=1 Tax=Neobacillus mesonae TaxID=1193713 RepID=UPI002E1D6CC3|nr:GerAB/ArcD/ProY family transporter [Neobacillus mesonae]MED4205726.1 GerAB/ArcD/ProY family transporter [Neobacillus mesonae]
MKQQPGKLGIREYVSIAVLMVGAKGMEDTPAMLFKQVENAAWMVPILSGALFFIPVFLLLKTLSVFQNKNLFSVIQLLLGRFIGFFVCLLIFGIFSCAISVDTRTYVNIINTYYFTTTPNLLIYAILMAVCAYGAKKGIQHVGSVAYLLVFYAAFSMALALFLSTKDSNLQAMLPIWGAGKLEILKNSSIRVSTFSEFFLLGMIIPYLKLNKEFRKGTWIAYVTVSIQISVSTLIFICMFDDTLRGISFPFHTAIRYISLGSYIPNIEIFFFVIWILAAIIRFTALLYILAMMFGHIFKIKDFEYLIPSLAAIYLLIGSIPESFIEVTLNLKQYIKYTIGPMFTSIAIMLWLAALLKGEFKHAKNKNST